MEKTKDDRPDLSDQIKDYVETRIKLARYQAIEKGTSFLASLVTEIFVIGCMALTFLFASVTVALLFSKLLGSYWMGFGCVTLIYLFLALVISALKTKKIQPKIIDFLIKKIFKQNNGSSN